MRPSPTPRALLALLATLLALGCVGASQIRRSPAHAVLFQNGQWFDGQRFVPGDRYSVDGTLRDSYDGPVTQRIDCAAGFVVPAFGEAHNHNLSRPARAEEVDRYVRAGVLYVLILNNMPPSQPAPDGGSPLSVVYANGGLTGPGGHVVELHERLVDRGVLSLPKEQLDGLAFFVADSERDLDRQWPQLLAGKPGIVKVFLGASEEYLRRRDDPGFFGKRGLNPDLVPSIVRRAHGAGLRVAAHIETAADFRVAVSAGADIIAHLPGWRVRSAAGFTETPLDRWLLTADDARRAAAAGVIVVTTALAGDASLDPSHADHEAVREIHRRNLETLRAASVRLALGSDFWNGTSVTEAAFLAQESVLQGVAPLGVFDNLSLLRLLCMDTPRAVFPHRRIGGLADGDEATFLVLEGNPIASLRNLMRIRTRVVRGEIVRDFQRFSGDGGQ